jgi:hypothetical protein
MKGVDAQQGLSYLNTMFISNSEWMCPIGPTGRRIMVSRVSDRYAKHFCEEEERKEYFGALFAEIKGGGIEAMMWDLMRRPIDDWNPQDFPVTKELVHQKQKSLKGYARALEEWLQSGELPRDEHWTGTAKFAHCATSAAMMAVVWKDPSYKNEHISGMKRWLGRNFAEGLINKEWRVGNDGHAGVAFASLRECRELFARKHGGQWDWDEVPGEWRVANKMVW